MHSGIRGQPATLKYLLESSPRRSVGEEGQGLHRPVGGEVPHPEMSGMGPVIWGFCASTRDCRLPAQAPVLQAAGTVPDRPESVKSTCWTALRPARSVRLPTSHVPLKMLGPSWEMMLHCDQQLARLLVSSRSSRQQSSIESKGYFHLLIRAGMWQLVADWAEA